MSNVGIPLVPDDGLDETGYDVYEALEAGRLKMVDQLRIALATNQLIVHYQPKIDLRTREVNGVEALVRWDHPTRGLLYPQAFLNVVEEAGLMGLLTRRVLAVALDQVEAWRLLSRQLIVSVNLSASSLLDSALPDDVAGMLASRDLPPDALQLEISQEALMVDRDKAIEVLTRLRSHGVQISLDGAGTGYSSMSNLRDLPIDELKLDRSLTSPISDDVNAATTVASTIGLAHSLDLRMVAEGVETNLAYAILRRLGCDEAQGYLMSRPVSAAELDEWLRARRANPSH